MEHPSITKTMFVRMTAAGMKYGGEITSYCHRVNPSITETIAGYAGAWWRHEFGGLLFVPFTSDAGYKNLAGFESTK